MSAQTMMPHGTVSVVGLSRGDVLRVETIRELSYQAIDVVQRLVLVARRQQERKAWLDGNQGHVDYSVRMAVYTKDAQRFRALHDEWIRLARACRVQALRMNERARAKLVALGLDYRQTTGDSVDDLRTQWAAIFQGVNTNPCPF